MMALRTAQAAWDGTFKEGKGRFEVGSGLVQGDYTAGTRFEEDPGTNPEELIGAAHAACFSMALTLDLEKAGATPRSVSTTAKVHLDKGDAGSSITSIDLVTEASVDGVDDAQFQQVAEGTRKNCPVSRALASVPTTLEATLLA
jgi:osmotically inducible protein OsmC